MVTVRRLEAGDRARWDPLWEGYLGFYQVSLPPYVTDTTWRRLVSADEDMHGLCALDAGKTTFIKYQR